MVSPTQIMPTSIELAVHSKFLELATIGRLVASDDSPNSLNVLFRSRPIVSQPDFDMTKETIPVNHGP